MTTPYSEPVQGGEWYQFDPDVHYYYDEQGRLHYYDPNTNQECEYQPEYGTQQQHDYYNNSTATTTNTAATFNTAGTAQSYTPMQHQHQYQQSQTSSAVNYAADLASSRQGTPDVLTPCPDPTCNGENKPKSKFCEECGRPLGAISRTATPASSTPLTNMSTVTRAFSQHQIQDSTPQRTATPPVNYNHNEYYSQQQQEEQQQQQYYQHPAPPQAPLQRPPTAPVYSTTDTSHTVPLYHSPSVGDNNFDPRQHQSHLYHNGAQHQSMQDLYGLTQQQQRDQYTANTAAYNNAANSNDLHYQPQHPSVDPLDRARGCPIVTFGFGGKMLVTFPRTVTNYYSSTVKPQPGPIKIKYLKDVVKMPATSFPGPGLFDSKIGTKQKKKDIGNYISQRVDEFEKEKLAYGPNTTDYHQLQAKILLWQLVKAMVESDGNLNDK
jgi:hypothetical protein